MVNSLLLADYNFTTQIHCLIFRYFLGKPDGRRNAGRPKLKELDCFENDAKSRVCQEMEEESRRQICMDYHCEGGTV
jgi:hypothetical protein